MQGGGGVGWGGGITVCMCVCVCVCDTHTDTANVALFCFIFKIIFYKPTALTSNQGQKAISAVAHLTTYSGYVSSSLIQIQPPKTTSICLSGCVH